MPIIDDPTSPIGKTLPLQQSDIVRMRSAVDDQHIAAKAYNLDPGFRKAADYYRSQQLDPQTQKRLPSLLLNRYYYGKWELEKIDPLTTALAQDATQQAENSANPFGMTKRKEVMSLGERLGSAIPDTSKSASPLIQSMGNIVSESATNAATGLNEAAADYGAGRRNLPSAIYKGGSEMAFGAGRAIASPLEAVAKPILEPAVMAVFDSVQKNPGLLGPLAQMLYQASSKFAADNPMAADIAESTAKWASLPLAITGMESTINTIGGKTASLGKSVVNKIDEVSSAKEAVKQAKIGFTDVQESVMPPTTKKTFQDANANLKNEGSFFKAPSLNATDDQIELAKVADSLKNKGYSAKNTAIANEKVAQNSWAGESKELLKKMQANDAISPDKEIFSAIKQSLEKQGFATDTGVGKKVLSAWEDALTGNSNGKISGQWKSKINFSQEATRKWGNAIYERGTDLADAVNASHEAANGVISLNSARAGVDYAGQMERLTKIHRIIENLKLQQSGGALRSTAGNLVRNPLVKIGAGAVGLAGATKLIP